MPGVWMVANAFPLSLSQICAEESSNAVVRMRPPKRSNWALVQWLVSPDLARVVRSLPS